MSFRGKEDSNCQSRDEADKERLLQLIEQHNASFPNRAEDDEVYDPAGVVERLDVAGPGKSGPGDVLPTLTVWAISCSSLVTYERKIQAQHLTPLLPVSRW